MTQGRKKYKRVYLRFLYGCLGFGILALTAVLYINMYRQIPGNIKLKAGIAQTLELNLPVSGEIVRSGEEQAVQVLEQGKSRVPKEAIHVDLMQAVTMKAQNLDSYQMNLKLFGIIPFKQVEIQVIQEESLIPMGIPIGIYVKTQGVLVIGVGEFTGQDGITYAPAKYLLKSGDYIMAVNGTQINSKQDFTDSVEECGGSEMVLTVRRQDSIFDIQVQPALNQSGTYKIGIWIRDNAQGIGTMTFLDADGNFGALGHGINDIDTGTLMTLDSGTLYDTNIISIKRGTAGYPGEMTGMITYADSNILGVITENTSEGIYGCCNEKVISKAMEKEAFPIGLKQEVTPGPAQILCSVEGEPKYYEIEIEEIYMANSNLNRGMLLKVTDEDLLALTGGIVQGMSGAPIIQNGKLIGAVTHVLVQDATRGYGIFIENMLEH